jgi:hypothetical protein
MNQLEMIRGGITTFIDIFRYPDEAAQVASSRPEAIPSPRWSWSRRWRNPGE